MMATRKKDAPRTETAAATEKARLCKLCLSDQKEAAAGPGPAREKITFPTLAQYAEHIQKEHDRDA
jgi:hypothetical protein